jgi:ribosome-associated toxin RatA of RatAB toxin-antitoxin module
VTTISVSHMFEAPIDQVFEAIINADKYPYVSRLVHVQRIKPASATQADGVGTLREVELGVVWFKEEFTYFERNKQVDYKIFESRPHFEHQSGSFVFKRMGKKMTKVTWTTSFHIPVSIAPKLVDKITGWMVKAAFKSALMVLENKLLANEVARVA